MRKKLFIFLPVLITGVFILTSSTKAQEDSGVLISPTFGLINLKPGETTKTIIKVTNPGGGIKNTQVSFNEFTDSGDGSGVPNIITQNTPGKAWEWLSGQQSIRIGENQTAEYELNVAVPQNTPTGSYYVAVRFLENSNRISPSVASIFVINVGSIEERVEIDSFAYDKDSLTFTTSVRNVGNGYTRPSILMEIFNESDGSKVLDYDLNQSAGGILADSFRNYKAEQVYKFDPAISYKVVLSAKTPGSEQLERKELIISPTDTKPQEQENKNDNNYLLFGGIGLLGLIVVCILVFVIKKKKAKKNRSQNNLTDINNGQPQ